MAKKPDPIPMRERTAICAPKKMQAEQLAHYMRKAPHEWVYIASVYDIHNLGIYDMIVWFWANAYRLPAYREIVQTCLHRNCTLLEVDDNIMRAYHGR